MVTEEKTLTKITKCAAVGICRSTYYSSIVRMDISRDEELLAEIQSIVLEYHGYGYRRVKVELMRRGTLVNKKKVLRIMRENNLLCKRRKYKIITTDSDHGLPVYPNLAKNMVLTRLNQLWVSDITYILLPHEHVYLAVIIDVFSRKIVGWALSRKIDAALAVSALHMAISERKHMGLSGLVHHSDQGVQYASNDYVMVLEQNNIKISMSRRGNPYDNAFAESFMKTLKIEEVYVKDYRNYEEVKENILHFMGIVYNTKRVHSSIGYLTPTEFETQLLNISLT